MPPRRRRPPRPGALSSLPPLRILRSIILLQAAYYTTSLILILFTTLVLGQNFTPSLVLDWRAVRGDSTLGWIVGMCWLLTGFVTYVSTSLSTHPYLRRLPPLCQTTQNAKCTKLTSSRSVIPIIILTTQLSTALVPDFALTIHFLHLLTTSFYTRRIPTNLLWWALQAASAGLMVLLGVWVVRYREVQKVTGFGKRKVTGKVDEGDGGGGGGGQGGSYEMVQQQREADGGGDDNV